MLLAGPDAVGAPRTGERLQVDRIAVPVQVIGLQAAVEAVGLAVVAQALVGMQTVLLHAVHPASMRN